MRAILINPVTETVEEFEFNDKDGLKSLYEGLTIPGHKRICDDINSVRLDSSHYLWVDGEGLLFDAIPVFHLSGYSSPLAGRGIILGLDETGDNAPCTLDINVVKRAVIWTDTVTTGEMGQMSEKKVDGWLQMDMGRPVLRHRDAI